MPEVLAAGHLFVWNLGFPGQAESFSVPACPGCVPVECRKLAGSRRFTLALIDAFGKGILFDFNEKWPGKDECC